MSKVSNLELSSDSAPIVADQDIVIDHKGRRLKIKQPDALWASRLMKAVGSDAAMNPAYMQGYVFPAASVVEIDGEAVPFPTTMMQIEALIQRLGDEAIGPILSRRAAEIQALTDGLDAATSADRAAVKN